MHRTTSAIQHEKRSHSHHFPTRTFTKTGPSPKSINIHYPEGPWVLGFRVIVIIVQVLGKYMIIGYLDP